MSLPRFKDKRLEAKRAGGKLSSLVDKARAGERGRAGAEDEGVWIIRLLFAEYVSGESDLGVRMRSFVGRLMDKNDPVRRDMDPTHWQALWPTLNTLHHARERFQREHLERLEDEGRQAADAGPDAGLSGPGVLGNGAGVSQPEGGGQ